MSARLLNLKEAAQYLGLSYWTVRDYLLAGHLQAVHLPALAPREGERAKRQLRRVLIDRSELDAFVDRCKG